MSGAKHFETKKDEEEIKKRVMDKVVGEFTNSAHGYGHRPYLLPVHIPVSEHFIVLITTLLLLLRQVRPLMILHTPKPDPMYFTMYAL